MSERIFINGVEMKSGLAFGREITVEEAKDKKKLKAWLEEDNWEIKDGR